MDVVSQLINNIQSHDESGSSSDKYRDKLQEVLKEMVEMTQDMAGAMLTTRDGHAVAQVLPQGFDAKRFAAMSSALQALATTLIKEAGKGATRNVMLEGDEGNLYLLGAGTMVMTVFTKPNPNLGLTLAMAKKYGVKVQDCVKLFT